ncbi:putative serine/threonine-protein kinase-like protein CCR3 [Beta vulgaris subsp. vulgaris]|uniref:putative serine/threonine-protein kinase-like protein CCR3 n=1 Tax=Beta vulgaris subsp. vulgaris TaxID=3555 RepID=UPI002037194A|nr:putative serine/threonine-protein kinase-like protein CCR3 [Beta vulgaris subsp. vulgaris]
MNPLFSAIFFSLFFLSLPCTIHGLGSGATLSLSSSNSTVCGIVSGEVNRRIECYKDNRLILIQPNISYDSIVGGESFFCGLRSGGSSLLCWDTNITTNSSTFTPKRIYFNNSSPLSEISVGDNQVCGIVNGTNEVKCWRGMMGSDQIPSRVNGFQSISSGFGFSCGILVNNSRVRCWGSNETLASEIESQFGVFSMSSLIAGGEHVCGFNSSGFLICRGRNDFGQLNFPFSLNESFGFSNLALGLNYSCAIRQSNGSVVCWGGNGEFSTNITQGVDFQFLVGGLNFVCGLITRNSSIMCWGPGWLSNASFGTILPLSRILPGPCVQSECSECGIYPESQSLCVGSGNICQVCRVPLLLPPSSPIPFSPILPPTSSPSTSRGLRRGLLAFAIVGSVGGFAGICTIIYCLYTGVCFGRKKIHNSVQPTITRGGSSNAHTSSNSPPPRSLTLRRQASLAFRRQRSGTSSTKHADRAEEFTFQELADATDSFSLENKIGSGSFGVVYRGKLVDGREVAIKRGETGPRTKKYQEKESAFESELSFLSRVHHKHLVRLVGYCEERDERLLVYDYMKNGALYDHLHDKKNVEKGYSVINGWQIRIKIALDAARGIEYLHNYAVPPIIHRDIKSSNILLDSDWTARVSDFGLSLMGPESDQDLRPTKAAGTVGYIDPEYYGLNVLTAKSDVYGLGVVLLELLTGKRAIFRSNNGDGDPTSVVDFAVPAILAGELVKILDQRVGLPETNEIEAVELVAYTALHCVHLEGKDRPTMADIVSNLERALTLCDDSHGSISSIELSIGSD